MYNDKSTKSVADAVAKILEASTPKTEKEKDLAALGHPKDKITHKDVLIGRGVLKKEEVEEKDPHDRMMDTAYNAALKAGHKPHSMGFTKDRKKVKMISDTGHGHYDIASKKYVHSKVNEEVEQIDELSTDKLTAYTKAAKTSRAELNKKWTQGKASWRDKEKVINREKGEDRANKILDRRAVIDKEMKEETESLPFTSMLESYAQGGMKAFFENFVVQEEFEQVEEEATSDEFVSELEKAKRKAAGKEKNEISKAAVQAVQNEEVEQIDELKKTTLMSYKEKNWKSTADAYNKGDDKKVSNRLRGMSLASRKLAAAAPLPMRKEEVELDEMALSADHKAALKTLKSIPSNYSHDDLKKLQAHLSDLHSKASDAERTARHAKQAEVRKANKDRNLKVTHELEGRSANYTNDDGHRLHITRDKNTGGYHAHVSNAKGKYVDSGGKTTLMYNHKVGKYAKHFKEEVDHDQED